MITVDGCVNTNTYHHPLTKCIHDLKKKLDKNFLF